MGGGKRNYNAMRQQFRKKVTIEVPSLEIEEKAPSPENVQNILELWKKAKGR